MARPTPAGALVDVAPRLGETSGWRPRPLPADILDRALSRLQTVTLVVAGLFAVSVAGNLTLHLTVEGIPLPEVAIAARVLGIALSLAFAFVLRRGTLDPQLATHLGLAYEVVLAALIAIAEPVAFHDLGIPRGIISFVAIWIFMFRLIVPTAPLRGLLASVASASMVPLSMWLSDASGLAPFPEGRTPYAMVIVTFVLALLAWFIGRSLYDLGREVARARELGAYKLETRLGQGGMGEVWRASHRMLKRPAAIKLIRADLAAGGTADQRAISVQRFEREARATAALQSKHTVQLFDFGVTRDGAFYYVMELLDGLDLEQLVRSHGPVPPARTVFLLEQLCHSLIDAHERGMIHRDIKPANLLLCRLGPDYDFLKVLDFGLVKETAVPSSTSPGLTNEGVPVGTPSYMAPEVALGSAAVTARTDIYMVGCVAYWLLTGQLVFEGETPIAVISQHIAAPVVPPSERTELPIPPDLERLVLACLAKDPDDRPATTRDLLTALRACDLPDTWTQEAAAAWWNRHYPRQPASTP